MEVFGGLVMFYVAYCVFVMGSVWVVYHLPEIIGVLVEVLLWIIGNIGPGLLRLIAAVITFPFHCGRALYRITKWLYVTGKSTMTFADILRPGVRPLDDYNIPNKAEELRREKAWETERARRIDDLYPDALNVIGLKTVRSRKECEGAAVALWNKLRDDDQSARETLRRAVDVVADKNGYERIYL